MSSTSTPPAETGSTPPAETVTGGELCSCSPTQFEFVLTLIQTCDVNDLATNGGIIDTECLIAPVDQVPGPDQNPVRRSLIHYGRRHLQDNDPIVKVQRFTFLEFDQDGNMLALDQKNDYTNGPYVDGDAFQFYSVSSMLDTSLPLEDQLINPPLVPGGASLVLYGETASGSSVRNRIWWTYQITDCARDTDPVQAFDKIGWVTVSSVASPWPAFCKRAVGSPTISPRLSSNEPTMITTRPPVTSTPPVGLMSVAPTDMITTRPPVSSTPLVGLMSVVPTDKRTRPPKPTTSTSSPSSSAIGSKNPTSSYKPTAWNEEPCLKDLDYLVSKASKSKSSKGTKAGCKSAKSWSSDLSMSLNGKVQKEIRAELTFYGASSRIKWNYGEMPPIETLDRAHSQKSSFAAAWELVAMFVLAAALLGWKFRRELFPDRSSREVVAGAQQVTEGDIMGADDDDEEIIVFDDRANIDTTVNQSYVSEDVSLTSEETEYVGDDVFTRTWQLINVDAEEIGSVGLAEEERRCYY